MISYRDLINEDLDLLVKWRNDLTVNRYLSDRLKTREAADVWFKKLKVNPNTWLKAVLEDERVVGYAVVESIDKKNRKCELALVIGETDYWGKGIGRTILEEMLEYAFNTLQMHRVWAAVARGNDRSERLLRRARFIQEGVMRETMIMSGEFTDLLCYSMLEDEYKTKTNLG